MQAPEIESLLQEYLALQDEEKRIKETKARLKDEIAGYMAEHKQSVWVPHVNDQPVRVTCRRTVRVAYDEPLLRERLGERYVRLLRPDPRKLRKELDTIEPLLAGVMDRVGSPDPDRVRRAIESGEATIEEFRDAFRKTEAVYVTVSRRSDVADRRDDAPFDESEED